MRKLYIYCSVILCLIVLCLTFLTVQPKWFPIESSALSDKKANETIITKKPASYNCPEKLEKAIKNNPDVYAWLNIPNTNIDYPVVQNSENDSYYLRRDLNGQYSSSGSILSEHAYNGRDFNDPVTVLYGHCMKSGAMFGNLQNYYSSENGPENYKLIEIYLPDKKLEYEVFAAVPYDTRHILYNYDFSNPRVFTSFFKSILSIRSFNANIINAEKPNSEDKVLILSTCLKGDGTKRYLVMAKLK